MLPMRDPSQLQRKTQAQSEGLEDDTPSKQCPEKRMQLYVYQTKQISGQKKIKKEKDGHLKMIKGDNPPRRHNIY